MGLSLAVQALGCARAGRQFLETLAATAMTNYNETGQNA
jgi:hypothetical protein